MEKSNLTKESGSKPKGRAAKPKLVKARLRAKAPQAQSVCVAGSFSMWKPLNMTKRRGGVWEAELKLEPGNYEYRYLIDGQWSEDPENGAKVANPFGGSNSLLTIPA